MNQLSFDNRVAVVTGGAQGIGLAVAKRLLASGASVAIWDADQDLGIEAAEALGDKAVAVGMDQRDIDQIDKALSETERLLGPVVVLIANAGIAGSNGPVVDYDPAEWNTIIDVNLNGVFNLCRAILPGMLARDYGRVVNIASIAGKEGNPLAAAYSASKAGVIALTKSLGKETADKNISVNCVTPAAAHTRIFDQMSKEHIDYMLSKIPRGRFLLVEEAAAMISWLASSENSFATGGVFDLSGGRATY